MKKKKILIFINSRVHVCSKSKKKDIFFVHFFDISYISFFSH